MDFGAILEKWDNQQGRTVSSKHSGHSPEEKVNPIDSWIRKNGIYDKDAEKGGAEAVIGKAEAAEKRRRLRNMKPQAALDIHGMTRDQASQALETFFHESLNQDLDKVLIIHGKGNHTAGEPVLKRVVMEFIEHCPNAGESGREKAAGGEGATWVLLKKKPCSVLSDTEH
jgi:DNA-nicking Smr family endonuclease